MFDAILVIFVVVGLAAISPGPDVAVVISRSLNHGFKAGILSCVGIALGLILHLSAVAFGLVSILSLYPWIYTILKILGALYLVWIAFCLIKEKASSIELDKRENVTNWGSIKQGFLTNVLNPKALIFFVSIFPQLIELEEGNIKLQLFVLSITAILAAFVMHSLMAFVADKAKLYLMKENSKLQKYQNYALAFIFVCFAINLLLWEF